MTVREMMLISRNREFAEDLSCLSSSKSKNQDLTWKRARRIVDRVLDSKQRRLDPVSEANERLDALIEISWFVRQTILTQRPATGWS